MLMITKTENFVNKLVHVINTMSLKDILCIIRKGNHLPQDNAKPQIRIVLNGIDNSNCLSII